MRVGADERARVSHTHTRFFCLERIQNSQIADNLSAQQSAPVNRRSAAPYNVSRGAYRAMVDVVREDVQQLEQLTGRDWGWPRLWRRQLAQCDRDKVCYVNLVPTKDPDTPL